MRPETPEPTPVERFEDAARRILQVPKKEAEKVELRRKEEREVRTANEHRCP